MTSKSGKKSKAAKSKDATSAKAATSTKTVEKQDVATNLDINLEAPDDAQDVVVDEVIDISEADNIIEDKQNTEQNVIEEDTVMEDEVIELDLEATPETPDEEKVLNETPVAPQAVEPVKSLFKGAAGLVPQLSKVVKQEASNGLFKSGGVATPPGGVGKKRTTKSSIEATYIEGPEDQIQICNIPYSNTGKGEQLLHVYDGDPNTTGMIISRNALQKQDVDPGRCSGSHLTWIACNVLGIEATQAIIGDSSWGILINEEQYNAVINRYIEFAGRTEPITDANDVTFVKNVLLLLSFGFRFNDPKATTKFQYYPNNANYDALVNTFTLDEKQAMYDRIIELAVESHKYNGKNNQFQSSPYQTSSFLTQINGIALKEAKLRRMQDSGTDIEAMIDIDDKAVFNALTLI